MSDGGSKEVVYGLEDVLQAAEIRTGDCAADCPCQSVHVLLLDMDGDVFATATFSPELARRLAAELLEHADQADQADLRLARMAGRLS